MFSYAVGGQVFVYCSVWMSKVSSIRGGSRSCNIRSAGRGLFRKRAVRFSHWKHELALFKSPSGGGLTKMGSVTF